MQIILTGGDSFQVIATTSKGRKYLEKTTGSPITTTIGDEEIGPFLRGCHEAELRVRFVA